MLTLLDSDTLSLLQRKTPAVVRRAETYATGHYPMLRAHGLAVGMISHNLNHVFGVSDRITVMKTGRTVGTRIVAQTSQEEIVRMIMTGTADGRPPGQPPTPA